MLSVEVAIPLSIPCRFLSCPQGCEAVPIGVCIVSVLVSCAVGAYRRVHRASVLVHFLVGCAVVVREVVCTGRFLVRARLDRPRSVEFRFQFVIECVVRLSIEGDEGVIPMFLRKLYAAVVVSLRVIPCFPFLSICFCSVRSRIEPCGNRRVVSVVVYLQCGL